VIKKRRTANLEQKTGKSKGIQLWAGSLV